MITKKKQDEIERERSERENVRGGERERERGKSSERKKKGDAWGSSEKKHKNVKRPLNPINNSQWENPFENPGASAP